MRLRPLTDTLPKPMVTVAGKPFLEHLIEMLAKNGVTDVVLLLGYLPEKITRYFGDGSKFGVRISYSIGKVDDETGTRLRNAKDLLAERFLLMYCDNYWPLKLAEMTEFYSGKNTLASTVVYNNRDGAGEYGAENNVHVSPEELVGGYDSTRRDPKLNGVDIGFFILNKKIMDMMPGHNFSFQEVVLPQLIQKKQLAAYRTDERYYTITSVPFLRNTEAFLAQKNG